MIQKKTLYKKIHSAISFAKDFTLGFRAHNLLLIGLLYTLYEPTLLGLPIGFGRNQADLAYDEIRDQQIIIYHDSRAPDEAKMVLESLQKAQPVIDRWIGSKSSSSLPIIMSAATHGASFANIATNNLEIQTLGYGHRDLFWHEFVHHSMYQHYNNWFGPAGAILQMPWMTNWWIEGLAESFSQSQGSDLQAAVERHAARTGQWPSFNSLHSLYRAGANSTIGYAISGGLVNYIFRTGRPENLSLFHKKYSDYTMPWNIAWSLVPYNGFMPMDKALEQLVEQKSGKEIFSAYKLAANQFWQSDKLSYYVLDNSFYNKKQSTFKSLMSLGENQNGIYVLSKDGKRFVTRQLGFKQDGSVYIDNKTVEARDGAPTQLASFAYLAKNNQISTYIKAITPVYGENTYRIMRDIDGKYENIAKRKARILKMFESAESLFWLEQSTQTSRICSISKAMMTTDGNSPIKCHLKTTMPKRLKVLGSSIDSNTGLQQSLYLSIDEQTIEGDRFKALRLDLVNKQKSFITLTEGGRPIKLVQMQKNLLAGIVAGRSFHYLRTYSDKGKCLTSLRIGDYTTALKKIDSNHVALGVTDFQRQAIKKIPLDPPQFSSCDQIEEHISPLLVAMRSGDQNIDLKTAFTMADNWNYNPQHLKKSGIAHPRLAFLSKQVEGLGLSLSNKESTPSKYRLKHVATFPWIGADPYGANFGIISLPLMEFSQNEELRITALYGLQSKFPDLMLTLRSTRFWPTLDIEAFKTLSDNRISLMNEVGGRIRAGFLFQNINSSAVLTYKHSLLKVYQDFFSNVTSREGHINEFSLRLQNSYSLGRFGVSSSAQGTYVPGFLNEQFDYFKLYFSQNLSTRFFLRSNLSLGYEYGKTRGKKQRALQERYRPLKTFVPGEGGGVNKIHQQLSSLVPSIESGSLFVSRFGNNQLRTKINWNVPIFSRMDKMFYIFYVDRLDFSSFVNYGNAWFGRTKEIDFDEFLLAHGYGIDLQLEIKGLNFNIGVGTGQVVGDPFDVYLDGGFDALF